MITTPGVTYRMFQTLAARKINILVISTSEIKISVLINKKIKLGDIISHVFNIKDYRRAFQKLISGNSLKIIIKPN